MKRKEFIKALGISTLGLSFTVKKLAAFSMSLPHSPQMPVMFVGHGNPMNAITNNSYSRAWKAIGEQITTPKAIVCISAHWETAGTRVTAMNSPKTIHDFKGFPPQLFKQQYSAPGFPELAEFTTRISENLYIETDHLWGLDHGTWSVLKPMFPKANIPVIQMSLDYTKPMKHHFEMAKILKDLRKRGVLIIGSGNIVHNLQKFNKSGKPHDWAIEFDEIVKQKILDKDYEALMNYHQFGKISELAVPTPEHYLPLLYTLALLDGYEELDFFNESIDLGSISMTSFYSL